MSRMEKRRRLTVTSRTKLAVMPPMSSLARMASSAFSWSLVEKTGLRTSRSRSGFSGDQSVELGQRLSDGLGLAVVLGKGEERRRIAAGDAGNECVVLCQIASPHEGVEARRAARPVAPPPPQEFVMIPLREGRARAGRSDPKGGRCLT